MGNEARGRGYGPTSQRLPLHELISGPGELRMLLRALEEARWPAGLDEPRVSLLHQATRICLEAQSPMLVIWGEEALVLYNDAALGLLADAHPRAFGAPADESRPRIWDVIGDACRDVLASGQPTGASDRLLVVERDGAVEERYVDLSYSPILADDGVAGVFCALKDTTAAVLERRRAGMLAELAGCLAVAGDETSVWERTRAVLESDPADLPFVLMYSADEEGATARLVGTVGVVSGSDSAPERIDTGSPDAPWGLARVAATREAGRTDGAFVLAAAPPGGAPVGYLVAGLSPRLPFDDAYRCYIEQVAAFVAACVDGARTQQHSLSRAEALERLRDSLQRRCDELTRLFEQAPVPIAVLQGPDFVVERANPAARDVVSDREVVGKPLFDALPELAEQGLDERLSSVLSTGRPDVGREARVRLRREARVEDAFFTFICAPLHDSVTTLGLVLIAVEVTDQVRARTAIRESEARYRSIFQSVDVSIWEEDYSGVSPLLDDLEQSGVSDLSEYFARHPEFLRRAFDLVSVVDVNEATLRMFGAREKDELIRALPDILLPETLEAFGEKLVAIAENRSLLRVDTAVRTLQGERRDVMMTMALPEGRGGGRLLVTLADITERRQMEQALREADRHKDEFLATLAHELRNPLAPLRSCVELLTTEDGRVPDGVLEIIDRQVDNLVRLVDDLLETSRIRRGTLELRRERVALTTVVRNALETSEPLIRAAGHELTVSLPAQPVWLDGDPVRLAQVIANLLNNAARYTRRAGRIGVEARRENGTAVISVTDTGIGIAPEELPRLFRMFGRVVRAGGGDSGGLGIGLALARTLVEMHGGTIEARSEGAGRGSEFVVRLPVASDGAPDEPEPAPAAGAPARRRVLIVDDNRDAAESLRMVLESLGAQVRTADSGPRALEIFGAFAPHLVLLDIGLPEMSGYETARRLRTDFPGRQAMLVALTGWGGEQDRDYALDAGFDRFLVKPAEAGTLRELLVSAGSRGRDELSPAGR